MANYVGMVRTNYFKVTNKERFEELAAGLSSEGYLEVSIDDSNLCCIASGSLLDYPDNGENNVDYFFDELSKIVAENDAAVFTEIGHEKLRYLVGGATIITRNEVKWVNLEDIALNTAREMLGNEHWETKNSY